MKKLVIISLLLLILGLFLGWWFGRGSGEKTIIEKIDTIVEHHKIDSLVKVIEEKEAAIDSLKDNVRVIREIQVKKVSEIKSLPLDSSVVLLRGNLRVSDTDTLPRMISTLGKDTLVEVSGENVRDINVTYENLRSEVAVNGNLEAIIREDSVVVQSLNGVITEKNSIIGKQNTNIGDLEKALKKEKRRKNRQTIIAGGLAVIFGMLNFLH
jgi:hypothetical protein